MRHLLAEGRVDEAGGAARPPLLHRRRGRARRRPRPRAGVPDREPATGERAAAGATASTRRSPTIDGVQHPAVTSVGVRPTIGDGRFTVETFLLDGPHDLYGARAAPGVRPVAARGAEVRRPRGADGADRRWTATTAAARLFARHAPSDAVRPDRIGARHVRRRSRCTCRPTPAIAGWRPRWRAGTRRLPGGSAADAGGAGRRP